MVKSVNCEMIGMDSTGRFHAPQLSFLRSFVTMAIATAAFGKWHNTAPDEITTTGPYDNWPTSIGFEYFYGFLAGESSQWEPRLVRNTVLVDPTMEREEGFIDPDGYHLSKDLAEDAVTWIRRHNSTVLSLLGAWSHPRPASGPQAVC